MLRKHTEGEKDDDDEKSESTGGAHKRLREKEGTARLLRRFKSSIRVS